MKTTNSIAVIGSGSWGSAIAILLANNDLNIDLYSHDPEVANEIKNEGTNINYLPDAKFSELINAKWIGDYSNNYEIVVNAVPTQFVREFYKSNQIDLSNKKVINCSKGIDVVSKTILHDIFINELNVNRG